MSYKKDNKFEEYLKYSRLLYNDQREKIFNYNRLKSIDDNIKENIQKITDNPREIEWIIKEALDLIGDLIIKKINREMHFIDTNYPNQNVRDLLSQIRNIAFKKIDMEVWRLEQNLKPYFKLNSRKTEIFMEMSRFLMLEKGILQGMVNRKKDIFVKKNKLKLHVTTSIKYKCSDKLYIPGERPIQDNCRIILNEKETFIDEANFKLLLRLVIQIINGKNEGWVNMPDIISNEVLFKTIHNYHAYIFRLKKDLSHNLLDQNPSEFIINNPIGNYKITTDPGNITYNRKNLMKNFLDDQYILELAQQLP